MDDGYHSIVRRFVLAAALCVVAGPVTGQSLREQIRTDLFTFGNCGEPLCLAGALLGHGSHFIPATQSAAGDILDLLGNSLAASVANTPVGATSSGVTYQFVGGMPVKTATSGGPIFGERSQTLGKGRFFVGTNFTAMHFERLRGVRMDGIVFTFTHENTPPTDTLGRPFFENDVIRVQVAMNVNLIVSTFVASYGVVDGVDLSVAVPVVHTTVQGTSVATIIPAGYPSPHRFGGTDSMPVMTAVAGMDGSATGIGDVAARLKVNLAQSSAFGVSILMDARFPTGNENNLLGSGGFDNSLSGWTTMAFELISEWQLGASKLRIPGPVQYQAPYPHSVDPTNIPAQRDDFLSASVGFKFQTPRGILLTTNALFPLRNSGMQPSVVWTGGLEYNF
ncbi:MAG: hypothetical protein AUI55_06250 [Gemmatimonadetes bacterium 13_1_40CM_2_70_7]|nr:MAG: hypothetical protein AUI55_06250 [Gemmatimonadetes bacterium 13_1_40CM_2_70_7]